MEDEHAAGLARLRQAMQPGESIPVSRILLCVRNRFACRVTGMYQQSAGWKGVQYIPVRLKAKAAKEQLWLSAYVKRSAGFTSSVLHVCFFVFSL